METLVGSIKASMKEQDRKAALYDLTSTWDGEMNLEVIEQGILERLRVMGVPSEGIRVYRDGLYCVKIELKEGNLMSFVGEPGNSLVRPAVFMHKDKFYPQELTKIGTWLIDNFYH